jgi:hypothetical protein
LLTAGARTARERERQEVAPDDRRATLTRADILGRVARRMRERDDQDLAVLQLPPAGHDDDADVQVPRRTRTEVHQEHGAERLERVVSTPSISRLTELRDQLDRLRLSALPTRPLRRLDELDAKIREAAQRRAVHAADLAKLGDPARGGP